MLWMTGKDRAPAVDVLSPEFQFPPASEFGSRCIEFATRLKWRMTIAMIECKRPSLGV